MSSYTRNCSKWSWQRKGYANIMAKTQKSLFNIWLNNLPFNIWFPQPGFILPLWPKQHYWSQCYSLDQSCCMGLKSQWNISTLYKATTQESYPLHYIQDTLDNLFSNNLFTILDLLNGYHQIEVRREVARSLLSLHMLDSFNIFVKPSDWPMLLHPSNSYWITSSETT